MTFTGANHIRTKLVIQDSPVEQVSDFNYLGHSITYQYDKEVESRIKQSSIRFVSVSFLKEGNKKRGIIYNVFDHTSTTIW